MITPGSVNPLLLVGNDTTTPCGGSVSVPSYVIKNSLRFRSSANSILYRNVSSASTNDLQCCVSFWTKIGSNTASTYWAFLSSNQQPSINNALFLGPNGELHYFNGAIILRKSNAAFRDRSAWYHIFMALDANAGASDRIKLYVNGVRLACTEAVWPTGQWFSWFRNGLQAGIGGNVIVGDHWFDGYMADVIGIDGRAADVSEFGEFDPVNGVWRAKAYGGTYGNNGYWLKFDDSAQIGKDSSGNNNHWTANNIDVAAPGTQATYDLIKDSPVMFDDGTANPPGNYCTLNAVKAGTSALSNGNLTAAGATVEPTIQPTSDTWYFEVDGAAKTWTPPAAFPAGGTNYNFGQRPFTNTPTGKILCTTNLPYCQPFDKPDGTAPHNATVTLVANEFKYLGYAPTAATGVTWGTQLDKLANGVKAHTAGTYTITNSGERFKTGLAQGNP